ncbi:phage filamentation protein Fil family protein [Cronobacter turicensis]|uniref:phage filamentation protein Fil family protein n=1 Tax=Cronobacter dublinensis TaxID=413497 RepID=UPI000D005ED5|nr:phage filamentation protein Fil family protein [Cronobacter dublinensis]
MRPFVSYLTEQSPSPQLNAFSHGWIELPNGQRWNPATRYKFTGKSPRCPLWRRLLNIKGGKRG